MSAHLATDGYNPTLTGPFGQFPPQIASKPLRRAFKREHLDVSRLKGNQADVILKVHPKLDVALLAAQRKHVFVASQRDRALHRPLRTVRFDDLSRLCNCLKRLRPAAAAGGARRLM